MTTTTTKTTKTNPTFRIQKTKALTAWQGEDNDQSIFCTISTSGGEEHHSTNGPCFSVTFSSNNVRTSIGLKPESGRALRDMLTVALRAYDRQHKAASCDYCNDKGTKAAPCDACGEGRY